MLKKIEKEKQLIARSENSLALEKLKRRKAETRRKIELGGLVIKAGMDGFNKTVILGAFHHIMEMVRYDVKNLLLFEETGKKLFIK